MTAALQNTGYNTQADVLRVTADGFDLNNLWAELQVVIDLFNSQRQNLVNLLTFPVVDEIERVPDVGQKRFERATEFGIPVAGRVKPTYTTLGYSFDDFDTRSAYTWKFLRDASQRQIDFEHVSVLEADNKLVFEYVLSTLFDNRNRTTEVNGQGVPVKALYNNDGIIPPTYKNTTFLGTHDHYMTSGTDNIIDPGDFEALYNNIAEHGYGIENGTTFVFMAPKAIINQIRPWRAGGTFNGVVANYDFIPSATQPPLIVPNSDGLIGIIPPSAWNGLAVVGSYRGVLLVEEDYIPTNYCLMFGSGGAGNLQNPVGLREHANPAYRGLRLLPGNQQAYPLVDSYYSRALGTGIRQRAAAAIMQLRLGAYQIPAAFNMQNVGT